MAGTRFTLLLIGILAAIAAVLAAVGLYDGVEQVKEECRDRRRVNFVEHLFQDLGYIVFVLSATNRNRD